MIVKVSGVPVHVTPPLVYVGVTMMVSITGTLSVFIAMNDVISLEPLVARPIVPLEPVQLYIVPITGPPKAILTVALILHTAWLLTGLIVGVGFTVMIKVSGVPVHVG